MSDYREVEIIVLVISDEYNTMIDESGNKLVTYRRKKLFPEIMTLEQVSEKIGSAIQDLEDSL